MYALFVIVWFADQAADVTSTASSNVTVISNVPVSATVASVQSIPIIDADEIYDINNKSDIIMNIELFN